MKKFLSKFQLTLLYLLPVVVFFSYYPLISVGKTESMNLELSLPLIWLSIFGVISLVDYKRIYASYDIKRLCVYSLFPFYITASILWSENTLRAILSSGIVWLILISILNFFSLNINKKQIGRLLDIHIYTAAVVSIWCLLQCTLDILGVKHEVTLLCTGCTFSTFGFPHPNGFAIEPQFMGNLLIIPGFISLLRTYYAIFHEKDKHKSIISLLLTFLIIITLYICFSRGAIYSFIISVGAFFIYKLIKTRQIKTLFFPAFISTTLILAICAQGLMAKISPAESSFKNGITTSISQLSLGLIDLNKPSVNMQPGEGTKSDEISHEPAFSGYVEESTTIRLNLNAVAIETWRSSPRNIFFGVGIGGTGAAIAEKVGSPKEIIQNEYLTILLELGLFGLSLMTLSIIVLSRRLKHLPFYFWSILIAFLISISFFSGLPNSLHIYLMIPLMYIFGHKRLYDKID